MRDRDASAHERLDRRLRTLASVHARHQATQSRRAVRRFHLAERGGLDREQLLFSLKLRQHLEVRAQRVRRDFVEPVLRAPPVEGLEPRDDLAVVRRLRRFG